MADRYNKPARGTLDWNELLNENFDNLDIDVEIRDIASNTASYSPEDGAKYLATDTGEVLIGNDTSWVTLGNIYTDAAVRDLITGEVDAADLTGESGTAGQYLRTDGTDASWAEIDGGAISISDDSVEVVSTAEEIDFTTDLDVADGGSGIAQVSVSDDVSGHVTATDNPHSVTASQTDALPTAGGTVTGELSVGSKVDITTGSDGSVADLLISADRPLFAFVSGSTNEGMRFEYNEANQEMLWQAANDSGEYDGTDVMITQRSGNVDIPEGELSEGGNRIATRLWATSANIDGNDLTGAAGTAGQFLSTDGTDTVWDDVPDPDFDETFVTTDDEPGLANSSTHSDLTGADLHDPADHNHSGDGLEPDSVAATTTMTNKGDHVQRGDEDRKIYSSETEPSDWSDGDLWFKPEE